MIQLIFNEEVLEILKSLNNKAPTVIYGGYIRDLLLNLEPNDVDMITNVPINILQLIFPTASIRKSINGHDVLSFKIEKFQKLFVEITSTQDNVLEKASLGDYTLNSLCFDGENMIDRVNGLKDIENKQLREVDIFMLKNDLNRRPYLWMKTIRLVAMTDFSVQQNVLNELINSKDVLTKVNPNIIQTEGYKILKSVNPIRALSLLNEINLLQDFHLKQKYTELCELKNSYGPHFKLCLLALITNKTVIEEFVQMCHFPVKVINQYNDLFQSYINNVYPNNSIKAQIKVLKKILEK